MNQEQQQPWDTYPRPQLRRASFLSLNGNWEFDLTPPGLQSEDGIVSGVPITIPFPPESPLSGVGMSFPDEEILFYRKKFILPADFLKGRTLLHFDAVDQTAELFLNGHRLGKHEGGYDSFCFDITDVLLPENDLLLRVEDRLDDGIFPYGKQKHKRGGMWYTPVSGIWQSVWIENVPSVSVSSLSFQTKGDLVFVSALISDSDPDGTLPDVRFSISEREGNGIFCEEGSAALPLPSIEVLLPETEEGSAPPLFPGNAMPVNRTNTIRYFLAEISFRVEDPKFWSPETPFLYGFGVRAENDFVTSYFGLRDITAGKDSHGIPRIFLNGKPYYFHGVLDQGYFPDGIFIPASPDRFIQDLQMLKDLGFNMLRKHIKIEPQLFYYFCDRLGIAVFQDMPENGKYNFVRDSVLPTLGIGKRRKDRNMHRDPILRTTFRASMRISVSQLRNHPSIIAWTIFNEGWGQFDGSALYHELRMIDDTRLIDTASGWFSGVESDFRSEHIYFRKPGNLRPDSKPLILSEFGGFACAVPDHIRNPKKKYGYRFFRDRFEWQRAVRELYEKQLFPLVLRGLSADILTQLSDIEDELNGLVTYDRAVIKADPELFREISRQIQETFRKAVRDE